MLTRIERHALPLLAAQVSIRHPGASLEAVDGGAVLTFAEGVDADEQRQAIRLVATTIQNFRVITPDDPPPARATEEWLAENQRGSRLDSTLTTFSFR